jgi:hypothetical protein
LTSFAALARSNTLILLESEQPDKEDEIYVGFLAVWRWNPQVVD